MSSSSSSVESYLLEPQLTILAAGDYHRSHMATKNVTTTRTALSKPTPTSLSRVSFEPLAAVGVPALLPAVAGVCELDEAVVVVAACDPLDELMMPDGRGNILSLLLPPVAHSESHRV